MGTVDIRRISPMDPQARDLIGQLDRYQESLYPPESNHLDPPDLLERDGACLVGAWTDDRLVGIGALKRPATGQYGEIKRVYVLPGNRGQGIARQIVATLESRAREAGIGRLLLETGVRQPEALALYEKLGYIRCGAFGDYPEDDPMSVFMEKLLA